MERKLAAILVADVVGYSGMMERDEAGTFTRLKAHRTELAEPTIAAHRGRIFKLTGDGLLVEFGSVVDAVECAAAIQRGMRERNLGLAGEQRIDLRIGVHVGDVIVEGEDRHGDAVNVAARLQQIAEPGGICVSRTVVDQVRQKVAIGFESRGEERLKNIAEPVSVYRVRFDADPGAQRAPLALPDRPSIAVLPFSNMSGDPEQEYFADGIVEEIITALSRMRWLFVIARNSSFTYKGRAVDVKQVGRELGVRYVLEGSVRKGGNRIRITGQLIDSATGAHLWADRFDGSLEDIFDLQDQVTASVVGAIAPKLEQAEIERSRRKPTENLDAYDYYLRGVAGLHRWSREGCSEALKHFYRAIELDPEFALAYGMAARVYVQQKAGGWASEGPAFIAETERLVRRTVELGKDDAVSLCMAGFALSDIVGDIFGGDALVERALQLNPNFAVAWLFSAWSKVSLGQPDLAVERVQHAMRLSPQDPQAFSMHVALACAHFVAGRYDEAAAAAQTAMRERTEFMLPVCAAAASAALAGRLDEARRYVQGMQRVDPNFRIAGLRDLISYLRVEDYEKWRDGLRLAGLPE